MKISAGKWSSEISLLGGRINELKFADKTILGTFDRIDGKQGNTHLCVPNFGDQGKELGLPFHGPARNAEWQVRENGDGLLVLGCQSLAGEKYPSGLYVEQKFILTEKFQQEITVKNTGDKEAPVNIGLHNYWSTPDGWLEAEVNREPICNGIRTNGTIPLIRQNTIRIPGMPEIILEQTGFTRAVLWSGFKTEKGETVYDSQYCCIEPVITYGEGEFKNIMLEPGDSLKASISIFCR